MDPNAQTALLTGEEGARSRSTKKYTYQDLIEFESRRLNTSVGPMIDSRKRTEPTVVFGTASRDKAQMIFQSKELSKSQFLGTRSQLRVLFR